MSHDNRKLKAMFDGCKCFKFGEDYKHLSELTNIYMIMFPFRDIPEYKYIFAGHGRFLVTTNSETFNVHVY